MKALIKNSAKLVLAGATIAAIGAGVILAGPQGDPEEARADIVDSVPNAALYGDSFSQVIAKSGMTPRAYEVNGNTVYFAVGHTESEPLEVLEEFQERFVKAGVNERAYTDMPDQLYQTSFGDLRERMDELPTLQRGTRDWVAGMLGGEVVPMEVSPAYVSMGGLVPRDRGRAREQARRRADSYEEFERVLQLRDKASTPADGQAASSPGELAAYAGEEGHEDNRRDLEELMQRWSPGDLQGLDNGAKGFRFLDAQKISPGRTRVTSVWAEDDFSFDRMDHPEKHARSSRTDVTVCPGCEVAMDMNSHQAYEPYSVSRFRSRGDVSSISDYYESTLPGRGWKPVDTSSALGFIKKNYPEIGPWTDGTLLHYQRGGDEMTVTVTPPSSSHGETRVHVFQKHQ